MQAQLVQLYSCTMSYFSAIIPLGVHSSQYRTLPFTYVLTIVIGSTPGRLYDEYFSLAI